MNLRTFRTLMLFPGLLLSSTDGLCQTPGYTFSIAEKTPSLRGCLHLTLSNNTSTKANYLIDLQGKFGGEWRGCMTDVFAYTWQTSHWRVLQGHQTVTLLWRPMAQKANLLPEKGKPYRFVFYTYSKDQYEKPLAYSPPFILR